MGFFERYENVRFIILRIDYKYLGYLFFFGKCFFFEYNVFLFWFIMFICKLVLFLFEWNNVKC